MPKSVGLDVCHSSGPEERSQRKHSNGAGHVGGVSASIVGKTWGDAMRRSNARISPVESTYRRTSSSSDGVQKKKIPAAIPRAVAQRYYRSAAELPGRAAALGSPSQAGVRKLWQHCAVFLHRLEDPEDRDEKNDPSGVLAQVLPRHRIDVEGRIGDSEGWTAGIVDGDTDYCAVPPANDHAFSGGTQAGESRVGDEADAVATDLSGDAVGVRAASGALSGVAHER